MKPQDTRTLAAIAIRDSRRIESRPFDALTLAMDDLAAMACFSLEDGRIDTAIQYAAARHLVRDRRSRMMRRREREARVS